VRTWNPTQIEICFEVRTINCEKFAHRNK
jgi:hypothetical protein